MIDARAKDNNRANLIQPITTTRAGSVRFFLVVAVQLVLLIAIYGQTREFGYVYYDDAEYVLENFAIHSGWSIAGLKWAFTSFYMSNWHPLTWLSHMLDVSLFGLDPAAAHVHNVILHGLNSLLVYALLLRYCGNWLKASFLSVIFLVHPLHVESVAWIAERKDLLCALFFLTGLLLYDRYRKRPSRGVYANILVAGILALLSKPMAVTFPAVLVILDVFIYRPDFQRATAAGAITGFDYRRSLFEKLPFILLSAAACATTIFAQDAGDALAYLESHSLLSRVTIAASAYLIYLEQALAPVNLVAFYPLYESHNIVALVAPITVLVVALALALLCARRLPLLAAGFCWYLVTLLPVIGLVQVGSQAHADRYMYLPSVGLLMACTYLLPSRDSRRFQLRTALACVFVVYLSAICYWQVGYWRNQNLLFSRMLAVIGPHFLVHLHLSEDYKQRGLLAMAREQAAEALRLRPELPEGYQAMGNVELAAKHFQEAEQQYRVYLSKDPDNVMVLNNLGIALAEQGELPEAIETFETALDVQPSFSIARQNLVLYQAKLSAAPQ